ncbi:MAG TPA: M48 family metallopeptidase [Sandaracinaceae bacterium LLY-WYZ-13_1]|nr:M48 family metallopeptidase [Sandaracinaceae bacterium LLY-WYZ-13_1]
MSPTDVYPPSPREVPEDLLRPTTRYRLQVAIVLTSLFVFLAFYLGLVAASGWLVFEALVYPVGSVGLGTILLKLGAVFSTGMLFAFLVKGLFKIDRPDRAGLIEVTEDEEPKLFAFIHRLVEETGAPMPKHVYLSPEVNAAVFYDSSILSLLLPTQKNLLIGLGLVNALNLSELKAVLGHELGHFSQGTMRLGSYVYVANHVIGDMVFRRDGWDDLLDAWRRQDLRIAVFGWILSAIVWAVRKALELMFRGINVVNAALSRQMEFDADRMAVRVAGSDAIVHSLVRSKFAHDCLTQTFTDLRHAGDHGLFSRDLFAHQTAAAEYLRRFRKDPALGVPSLAEGDPRAHRVFDPDDPAEPPPSMWASHPPDAERETNAKAIYLSCPIDERSAWTLFDDPSRIREEVTRHVLERPGAPPVELKAPDEVQAFIDEERAETTFDPRYHDMYEGRFLAPGDLDAALSTAGSDPPLEALLEEADGLWGPALEATMAAHRARLEEGQQLAQAIGAGGGLSGAVRLRGQRMSKREAEARLADVDEALREDRERLAALDARVLAVHVALARRLDALEGVDRWTAELSHRYRFQLGIQGLSQRLEPIHHTLEDGLAVLRDGGRQLEQSDFARLTGSLSAAHRLFAELLRLADTLVFPELRNMPVGETLGGFLLPRPLIEPLDGAQTVDGAWIQLLLDQLAEVEDKLQRLFFKSVGGLLRHQERIVDRAVLEVDHGQRPAAHA